MPQMAKCVRARKRKKAQKNGTKRGDNKKLCSPFGKVHEMKSIHSTQRDIATQFLYTHIYTDIDIYVYVYVYRWHTKSTFIVIIVSGNCHHKYLIVASIKAYDT